MLDNKMVFAFSTEFFEAARRRLGEGSVLSFGIVHSAGPGCVPTPDALAATTDINRLSDRLLTNHLMANSAPFALIVSTPSVSDDAPVEQSGMSLTLRFRPLRGHRAAWQLVIDAEADDHPIYQGMPAGCISETWPSDGDLKDFARKLKATLIGLEQGGSFECFGSVAPLAQPAKAYLKVGDDGAANDRTDPR